MAQCGFAARFETESGLAKNIGRDGPVHIMGRSAHRYGNAKGGAHPLTTPKLSIPSCAIGPESELSEVFERGRECCSRRAGKPSFL